MRQGHREGFVGVHIVGFMLLGRARMGHSVNGIRIILLRRRGGCCGCLVSRCRQSWEDVETWPELGQKPLVVDRALVLHIKNGDL